MNSDQNTPVNTAISVDTSKPKVRRRFGKLSADEISAFPGAITPAEKKVEPDISFSIIFSFLLTSTFGNAYDATQIYDFASKLDTQAKTKSVGTVTAVKTENGISDVVLTLLTTGEQSSYGAPAVAAFKELDDYLRSSLTGKSATWKAKVNGTTIITGTY